MQRAQAIISCWSNLALRRGQHRAARAGEDFRLEDFVELRLAHPALLQHEVVDALAGSERIAGNLGGARVAKDRRECGHEGSRFVEQAARALYVGGDSLYAAVGQCAAAGGEVLQALEQAKKQGLLTVALTGYDGGKMKRSAAVDFCINVSSDYIPRIQEAQATAYHALIEVIHALLQQGED